MEYEIDDDPQGEGEHHDGDRTGGVREDQIFRRSKEPEKRVRETQPA